MSEEFSLVERGILASHWLTGENTSSFYSFRNHCDSIFLVFKLGVTLRLSGCG